MLYTTLLTLLSNLPFLIPSASSQLIKADHHSFGGVNYPLLQYFTPQHRDATIQAIVKTKARVIRLFIRPDSHHTDPEPQLGEFDKSLLDQLDDTLAAIHRVSKGQIKVIIAPHDAHALRGSNDVPCDAYCEEIGGAFLDFYSSEAMRKTYKTRLDVFFRHYPSKNFGGRSWSELSEVIMVRISTTTLPPHSSARQPTTASASSLTPAGRGHPKPALQRHLAHPRGRILALRDCHAPAIHHRTGPLAHRRHQRRRLGRAEPRRHPEHPRQRV